MRGLTLRGYASGVEAAAGSDVAIEDVVIEASMGSGVFVEASCATVARSKISGTTLRADGQRGWGLAAGLVSNVAIDDATIVGGVAGVFAASPGTVIELRRSVVARQSPSGSIRSSGIISVLDAKLLVSQSVVRDVEGDGAVVADLRGIVEVSEPGTTPK